MMYHILDGNVTGAIPTWSVPACGIDLMAHNVCFTTQNMPCIMWIVMLVDNWTCIRISSKHPPCTTKPVQWSLVGHIRTCVQLRDNSSLSGDQQLVPITSLGLSSDHTTYSYIPFHIACFCYSMYMSIKNLNLNTVISLYLQSDFLSCWRDDSGNIPTHIE